MFLADGFNRTMVSNTYRYNLRLFKEIERFGDVWNVHGSWLALINLFGNVVCFIPFGFFVPFHGKALRSIVFVTCLTFLFSLLIEVTQLVFKIGVFDVDDLLLNTIGGFIGYLCYYVTIKVYIRIRRSKVKKEV